MEKQKMESEIELKCQNCKEKIGIGDHIIVDANGFTYCCDNCICNDFGVPNPGPEELVNILDIKFSGTLDRYQEVRDYLSSDIRERIEAD